MQEREKRVGPIPIPASNRTASPIQNPIPTSQSPTKVMSLSSLSRNIALQFFSHYRLHVIKTMNQH